MSKYLYNDNYYSNYNTEFPVSLSENRFVNFSPESVSLGFEIIKISSPFIFYVLMFIIIVGLITIICYIVKKLKPRYKKYTNDLHYDKVKNKIMDIINEKQNQKKIEDELEETENELINDITNN